MARHQTHQGGQIMFGSRVPTLHPHILIFGESTSTPTQLKYTETPTGPKYTEKPKYTETPTQPKNTFAHPHNQTHFRREEGERTEPTMSSN